MNLFLYTAILLVVGLFVLTVLFSGDDLRYVLRFRQHEWYRELRRDYFTSRVQFWRDWRSAKRFAAANSPWIYASGVGAFGLLFAGALLLSDMPEPLRASELAHADPLTDSYVTLVTRVDTEDLPASRVVPTGCPIGTLSSISMSAVGCPVDAAKPASLVVPRSCPVLLPICLPRFLTSL